MRPQIMTFALCLFVPVTAFGARGTNSPAGPIAWRQCLSQRTEFYAGDEAVRIADNVLLYQRDAGGWPKNIDMASVLSEPDKAKLRMAKNSKDSMLDNGATHTQMRYLARVYEATGLERFRDAFRKGLDYLLEAQYENGGWPQRYPDPTGYARHITFNDGAMVGAMSVLRDIADKRPPFAFVDERTRQMAEAAVQKGIDCILKCQIVAAGLKTAWCAQHDEKTFAPSKARSYELPSISGSESVGIVRFLMSIEKPSPRIVEAVQCAVAWFAEARLEGIRQVRREDKSKPGGWDIVIVKDASAPAMWARFYDIGTNKPIFCSRDGIPKATLAEISHERRTGYSWLGYYATDLLAEDYPAWQKKWAPERNVLGD
ncbi:MAG TPA: pectate lyase [Sedimentisphaerales bacterium]|nr:pectate lyase [Sedimentisphaerales bacterium]